MPIATKGKPVSNKESTGMTLVELLISMGIGLMILAAVVGMFVAMIDADSDNLKSIRLNQELRAVMSLITRDIRRVGSNLNAANNSATTPPTNPLANLVITSNQQGDANACVIYTYDVAGGGNGVIDLNERFGFRWDSVNATVESRSGGADCSQGGWDDITDGNLTEIIGLLFEPTTYVESGLTVRQITITLSGRLRSDIAVERTLVETIKIRNDF